MYYSTTYRSPVGILTLASDGEALAGLWISGQKYYGGSLSGKMTERDGLSVFTETKDWLDRYFAGEKPAICELELAPAGTAFQQTIWKLLCRIPYGQVTTYGALARQAAEVLGKPSMSGQAVGGAVGHNPISIIIPCHRVIGSDGSLTGYAGGTHVKARLLKLEGAELPELWSYRCRWANPKNERYLQYHDEEWGVPVYEDQKLFEMLVLESFQAGLSWECVLNKQEAFRKAFDGFDLEIVCGYGKEKMEELKRNSGIIRNGRKIQAAVENARIFRKIQEEYGSFSNYLWHWTDGAVIYEKGCSRSELSDTISEDLKKRGMKFVGTTIIYAYLQAVGVIYSHEAGCYLEYKKQG